MRLWAAWRESSVSLRSCRARKLESEWACWTTGSLSKVGVFIECCYLFERMFLYYITPPSFERPQSSISFQEKNIPTHRHLNKKISLLARLAQQQRALLPRRTLLRPLPSPHSTTVGRLQLLQVAAHVLQHPHLALRLFGQGPQSGFEFHGGGVPQPGLFLLEKDGGAQSLNVLSVFDLMASDSSFPGLAVEGDPLFYAFLTHSSGTFLRRYCWKRSCWIESRCCRLWQRLASPTLARACQFCSTARAFTSLSLRTRRAAW